MQLTVSRWGNSLAVRIPADVVRALALEEGAMIDCSTTQSGTLELVPAGKKARAEWLQSHFAGVNARLARQAMTTPASQLLREEERY
ncbi:MAG: AbrB/MazE/SpoVT family DNA-binding domain-containing protein [Sulfuricellaceae bacterium]